MGVSENLGVPYLGVLINKDPTILDTISDLGATREQRH